MKRYSVQKIGNLFIVKASIGRLNAQPSIVQLLVDTGASQTGLPIDFLTDIGCPITATTPQRKITTGNGVIDVPIVQVPWLNSLGQQVQDFPVLALQLPVSLLLRWKNRTGTRCDSRSGRLRQRRWCK